MTPAFTSDAWIVPSARAVATVMRNSSGRARSTTSSSVVMGAPWSFDREGGAAHLVAHGDDGRVGERAALPVRAVDHEGVAGDEPGVGRSEERRGPAELLHLAHAHRGLARV